jgi:hypothetical protein
MEYSAPDAAVARARQECMALSPEQRRRVVEARKTLLQRMDAVIQRRRDIIKSLQASPWDSRAGAEQWRGARMLHTVSLRRCSDR